MTRTGEEQPGSPLQSLAVATSFTRYVFADFSPDCVTALGARVGDRVDVRVLQGDANSAAHLAQIAALLNPRALLIAYLDPARPQDLHWSTVEYLATNFGFVDLIINLPVNSIMRSIVGAYKGGGTGPGTAGRFLNHRTPHDLLCWARNGRLITKATIAAIRTHYDEQLATLGFRRPGRRTIDFPRDSQLPPSFHSPALSRHQIFCS